MKCEIIGKTEKVKDEEGNDWDLPVKITLEGENRADKEGLLLLTTVVEHQGMVALITTLSAIIQSGLITIGDNGELLMNDMELMNIPSIREWDPSIQ